MLVRSANVVGVPSVTVHQQGDGFQVVLVHMRAQIEPTY